MVRRVTVVLEVTALAEDPLVVVTSVPNSVESMFTAT